MSQTAIDIAGLLAEIRQYAIVLARGGWAGLGDQVSALLPDPLDPLALLPIATGVASGAGLDELIPLAAAVVLSEAAFRIADDCADQDDGDALYQSVGVGGALNLAMTLHALAGRELASRPNADRIVPTYYSSFLQVCQGQAADLQSPAETLAEYEAIVRLKTVSAYEFAATVGVPPDSPEALALCADCGQHLGWMTQILDDLEALWFPVNDQARELDKKTFPAFMGLATAHPNAATLEALYLSEDRDGLTICNLLDEMNIRPRLMALALDHRDAALAILAAPGFNPDGRFILQTWLDWYLQAGRSLLEPVP